MPNPIAAGAGASVFSGMSERNAAKSASKTQSKAADAKIAETRRQFDTVKKILQPYVGAGYTALQGQLDLLGLGGSAGMPGVTTGAKPLTVETLRGPSSPTFSLRTSRDQDMRGRMTNTPGAITGFRVGDQQFANREEADAYARANGIQGTTTGGTPGMTADQAQQAAIDRIKNGSQFNELAQQGEYAILSNAAATGGLRGGNVQGALAQYRPAMLQMLIDKQLANLGGIAANGQNAAGGVGEAATAAGRDVNAATGERGQAQAGGYLGAAAGTNTMLSGVTGALGQFSGQSGGMPEGATLFSRWGF